MGSVKISHPSDEVVDSQMKECFKDAIAYLVEQIGLERTALALDRLADGLRDLHNEEMLNAADRTP